MRFSFLRWLRSRRRPATPSPAHGGRGDRARTQQAEGSDASDDDDVDPFDPFPEPVRLEIKDVFDLHSIHPRDVRAVVEQYLREAQRLRFHQVRIIHGKGVGVQREIVRGVLTRAPFVERFADAPPEAGGWGATIVYIRADTKDHL